MAEDAIPLASLSLTHVYYDPADPVSYLCAFLALVPQALCVVYATLIWSTREVEVALMFAGQLACEVANFALKRIIKEERPKRIHGEGYGMPSSHAQFVFFWAVALTLFLVVRHRPLLSSSPRAATANRGAPRAAGRPERAWPLGSVTLRDVETYAHRPWSLLERVLASSVGLVIASMVAWSRIYLNYHTPKQVLAGCLAGSLSAVAWFGVTHMARKTGLLAYGLDMPVARWFRIRDLIVDEDLCQAGWERWEDRKSCARQRKSS